MSKLIQIIFFDWYDWLMRVADLCGIEYNYYYYKILIVWNYTEHCRNIIPSTETRKQFCFKNVLLETLSQKNNTAPLYLRTES